MDLEKKLIVIDEQGNETEMEILFTFNSDEYGKQYVLFVDPSVEDGDVYASSYDDEGNLNIVEDEAEWAMIEEVLAAFVERDEEEETAEVQ
jgi:uncharacterized protein YrzB (UPF0473 family)